MGIKMRVLIIVSTIIFITSITHAVDYTEPVPLPELCGDTYQGLDGCLYSGGNNLSGDYQTTVNDAMALLEDDTAVNFLCVGMSNLAATCGEMINRLPSANVSSAVTVGNGGRPGRAIQAYDGASPDSVYTQFKYTNMSPNAVDVVVFFNAWSNPSGDIDSYLPQMTQAIREVYSNIQAAYPNVKLIYFVSRESAPDWASSLNPEPFNYWDGFAFRNVINERITGELSGVPLIWGPYQYDPSWPDSYFREGDGVHLSDAGLDVAGQLWLDFFMSQSWFADGDPLPTSTPAPTSTPGTPTATPAQTETAVPTMTNTPEPTPDNCPPWHPTGCATKTPRPPFDRGNN